MTHTQALGTARIDWSVGYLQQYYPDRVASYEHKLYLLELCGLKYTNIQSLIVRRFNELGFLITVGHVIKVLRAHPKVTFNCQQLNLCREKSVKNIDWAAEIYRSPSANKLDLHKNSQTFSMSVQINSTLNERRQVYIPWAKIVMTPQLFKITNGPLVVRKYKLIFAWISCVNLSLRSTQVISQEQLLETENSIKVELRDYYRSSPVVFNLLNQTARLLLP